MIDQFWANFKKGSCHLSGVIEYPITDHFPIFYIFSNNNCLPKKVISFRNINSNTINNFISSIQNKDFNLVYEYNDPNKAFQYFYDELYKIYNLCFKIKKKTIKININKDPWITPNIRKCIRKKYYLYNLLKRGLITRRIFNTYKNMLSWLIKKKRLCYLNSKFTIDTNDSKKTWKNINVLLKRGKNSKSIKLFDNGEYSVGRDMTNKFNNYFTKIASNLIQNISNDRNSDNDRLTNLNNVQSSCFIYPTNIVEVSEILMSLPNKGNPIFCILPKILISIKDKILPILTFLFNFCILKGIYPDCLKIARVVPIYKSGNALNVGNYRPISNLDPLNKIFELIIRNRLNQFITINNTLSEFQYGFRTKSSTSLAIFNLVSDFISTINKKCYTIALFIDLRKAFDLVNRRILLNKLYNYGIRGIVNQLIDSYLSNRKQFVNVGDYRSDVLDIGYGVPQGSVLGPFLFNLFINDVVNLPLCEKILFADDTVLYVSALSFEECINNIIQVIDFLRVWLNRNQLLINTDKSKLMLITSKTHPHLPPVYFDNRPIEWVHCIKYLGVLIDDRLSFNSQVDSVCTKLSKFRGLTYSLQSIVPQNILIRIFYGLIYPALTDNIVIWGGLNITNCNRIQILLNQILRNILGVKYDANNRPLLSTDSMYKQLKILKFRDIHRYFLLKFFHFIHFERFDIFIKHFEPLLPQNNYAMRSSRINLPYARTDAVKHFTIFQVCKLIRELPEQMLQPQSYFVLKKNFKEYALSLYR